jgi:fluoroacetyl-CoA thioesterase
MPDIPIGAQGEIKLLVTSEVAIDFMGMETARVLATPYLVWNLEMACHNAIKPYLEEGYDSVGTEVNMKHLGATPIGMSVTFRGVVTEVKDRRIRFRVEAFDEKEKIAEGSHERFIVNVARFATKVQAKAAAPSNP